MFTSVGKTCNTKSFYLQNFTLFTALLFKKKIYPQDTPGRMDF